MIALDNFVPLVRKAIPQFQDYPPNLSQEQCITHSPETPLMIVAGPGSGKTTVLVLRALRLVFVDGLHPEEVLITTFTKKAATEIRSRLIEWGSNIIDYLQNSSDHTLNLQDFDSIDINQFITGTLDSICNDELTNVRLPSDSTPVLVEKFVSNALFMFEGLFPVNAQNNTKLNEYLSTFTGKSKLNFKEKLEICRTIIGRLVHDQVNLRSYQQTTEHNEARRLIIKAFKLYHKFLIENNQLDYARLEELFYQQLTQGKFNERFTSKLKALLVDEYQDTNPLQESIYFELVRRFGASFTIVGDDDQSLYRFRGATVELFRDFVSRFSQFDPNSQTPKILNLVENYRSTPEIVRFFNDFITNDLNFTPARVGSKRSIIAKSESNQIPVLGMFRPDREQLADSLVSFLIDVFRGDGCQIDVNGQRQTIISKNGGNFGDSVFLSFSVNEYTRFRRERLPLLLRQRLQENEINVFNPRGRSLRDIPEVQQLLGTILECIDPQGTQQNELNRLGNAETYLNRWRRSAQRFVLTNPAPNQPTGLHHFVEGWQSRKTQRLPQWPGEWPLLDLCFRIVTWIPELHNDPEGQVYLEAVARCISETAIFSAYRSTIIFNPQHEKRSIQRAIRDILVPIAEGSVDVDEEIMPHVPRSHFPFMTIHQAKGLEYPLVIVDVSSDYTRNDSRQQFQRFPEEASSEQRLEDDLANHCEIGNMRMNRTALDRTFDDIIRRYYVAYSRPQSVLLLVGLTSTFRPRNPIKNIAMGWRRSDEDFEDWPWKLLLAEEESTEANHIPLHLIWD